ncbi:MAG TPA: SCP2 sterol-binding domain-containing protein [Thermoplasmata archaeon]|nr:SCP2 sterol-binding domain-containing protein [Thermoplasmata archaeon]
MTFPSAEWAAAYQRALNDNPAYRAAAKAWVGDILLLVRPESPDAPAPGVHLDLADGGCRAATFHADARSVASEFVYEGTPANWERLMRHELDPVKAILDGTFKVRGNLAKLMRFTRAAKELVETASNVTA